MASSALVKAHKALERRHKSDAKKRVEEKNSESKLTAMGGGTLGVALGASLDRKFGGSDEHPEEPWGGGLGNLLLGGATVVAGAIIGTNNIAGAATAGAGVGLAFAGVYRLVYDNTDQGEFIGHAKEES